MNNDQLLAFGRTLLTFLGTAAGTYLVSHGYLNKDQVTSLGGLMATVGAALLSMAPIVISLYGSYKANSVKSKTESVAASLPVNGQIITTPEIAAATSSEKIVAAPVPSASSRS